VDDEELCGESVGRIAAELAMQESAITMIITYPKNRWRTIYKTYVRLEAKKPMPLCMCVYWDELNFVRGRQLLIAATALT
jgi:hypothetical protein